MSLILIFLEGSEVEIDPASHILTASLEIRTTATGTVEARFTASASLEVRTTATASLEL